MHCILLHIFSVVIRRILISQIWDRIHCILLYNALFPFISTVLWYSKFGIEYSGFIRFVIWLYPLYFISNLRCYNTVDLFALLFNYIHCVWSQIWGVTIQWICSYCYLFISTVFISNLGYYNTMHYGITNFGSNTMD